MQIFHTIKALQATLSTHQRQGKTIALVPTMGNLHDGHLSLVDIAKCHADIVVVSIFVNPTQFSAGEDFDNYPRTFDDDCRQLQGVCDIVFAPSINEMYPDYPPKAQVLSGEMAKLLCGKTRPTHFDGVGLVVSKLFNIVRPDVAVFGKKDYQQLAIIRQLNETLNFGIHIIGGKIVRLDNGLALSSRNGYLTIDELAVAPRLNQALNECADELRAGIDIDKLDILTQKYQDKINQLGFRVDYLTILTDRLTYPTKDDKHLVILTASYLGRVRLLDNVEVRLV